MSRKRDINVPFLLENHESILQRFIEMNQLTVSQLDNLSIDQARQLSRVFAVTLRAAACDRCSLSTLERLTIVVVDLLAFIYTHCKNADVRRLFDLFCYKKVQDLRASATCSQVLRTFCDKTIEAGRCPNCLKNEWRSNYSKEYCFMCSP